MSPRRRQDPAGPPLQLREFVPSDWPTDDPWEALTSWGQARRDWQTVYGWPDGSTARIKGERDARRRLALGIPHEEEKRDEAQFQAQLAAAEDLYRREAAERLREGGLL